MVPYRKTGFLLITALGLGWLLYGLLGSFGSGKRASLQAELDKITNENKLLEKDIRRLAAEAKALRDNSKYIEKVAREELGLLRPDEIVFHFQGDDTRSESDGEAVQPDRYGNRQQKKPRTDTKTQSRNHSRGD